MGKKTFWAAIAIVGTMAGLVSPAAGNVFDDAVFWFRGGKDRVTMNGQLEKGFDFEPGELNAGWNDVYLGVEHQARTGYFAMDYYRFEIGLPIMGTYLILR